MTSAFNLKPIANSWPFRVSVCRLAQGAGFRKKTIHFQRKISTESLEFVCGQPMIWSFSFRIGHDDAQSLSNEFREQVLPSDLVALPNRKAYVSLMTEGKPSDPFLMETLKPSISPQNDKNYEALRNRSRSRYATPASIVHAELEKCLSFVTPTPTVQ